jgi:hypothetical protein
MISQYLLMSPSVALIDPKLGYKTLDRRNINRMRQNLRAAMWGMLQTDAGARKAAPQRKPRPAAKKRTA